MFTGKGTNDNGVGVGGEVANDNGVGVGEKWF